MELVRVHALAPALVAEGRLDDDIIVPLYSLAVEERRSSEDALTRKDQRARAAVKDQVQLGEARRAASS